MTRMKVAYEAICVRELVLGYTTQKRMTPQGSGGWQGPGWSRLASLVGPSPAGREAQSLPLRGPPCCRRQAHSHSSRGVPARRGWRSKPGWASRGGEQLPSLVGVSYPEFKAIGVLPRPFHLQAGENATVG